MRSIWIVWLGRIRHNLLFLLCSIVQFKGIGLFGLQFCDLAIDALQVFKEPLFIRRSLIRPQAFVPNRRARWIAVRAAFVRARST